MTNTLLDIYSSPHVDEYVSALREECERVYQSNGNKWTKAAVNELHRVDSAIKESMRFSSISLKMLNRVVVHKDGVKIGNTHYPPSVAVAVASGAIHRDPAYVEQRLGEIRANPLSLKVLGGSRCLRCLPLLALPGGAGWRGQCRR